MSLCTTAAWMMLACLSGERGSPGEASLLPTAPDGEDTASESGAPGGPGGPGSADDTGDQGDDLDGDGYPAGVDCDDDDGSIHPGVTSDDCDGFDEDCDDRVDEDAPDDSYERDDASASGGTDLGELTGDTAKLTTYLTPEGDVDAFYLYIDDGVFSWFDLDLDLEVPSGVDMAIELYWYDEDTDDWFLVDDIDEGGDGRNESLTYEGGVGASDTGWYGVLLYAIYGASCEEPYTLHIEG